MTIVDAIKAVLKSSSSSLSIDELYAEIVKQNLYEFRALDAKSVVRSQVRRHVIGLDFPSASPVKYFRLIGGDKYALESEEGIRSSSTIVKGAKKDRVPEEVINDAHLQHLHEVREALKQRILENHFVFFERLVIDLLLKMGYGGSDRELSEHTGGPGDEGIDGVIREDKLGLGKIYIQAKRYRVDREVRPEEIREFAGAMAHVQKGVFITTSFFTEAAVDWIERQPKTIRLVNGDELCDLMIAHGIGVSEIQTVKLLRVDTEYFANE